MAAAMLKLQELGAPPSIEAARYYALTGTLADFFGRAYDHLQPGPEYLLFEGAADYTVASEHTQELLDMLNPALGTSHSLPPWSFMGD